MDTLIHESLRGRNSASRPGNTPACFLWHLQSSRTQSRRLALGLGCLALLAFSQPAKSGPLLYAVDNATATIYTYDMAGNRSVFTESAESAQLGLGLDAHGNVYATALIASKVYKFAPDGTSSIFANLVSPYGLAIDTIGNVFVSSNGTTVVKYSPDGVGSEFAAGLHLGSLAFDGNGDLFVGQPIQNGDIYKITPSGSMSVFASNEGMNGVYGMAFSPSGDLYAGAYDGVIYKFSSSGQRSIFANRPATSLISGLAFGSDGTLYEAEFSNVQTTCCNQVINAFAPNGDSRVFASGLARPAALAFQADTSAAPEPNTGLLLAGIMVVSGVCIKLRRVRRAE